jgi:hypothetical protein
MPHKVTTLSNEKDFSIFDDDLKPKTWNLGKYKHQNHFSFSLMKSLLLYSLTIIYL